MIVTSRSVDRCITTLRSKIEPDPRKPTFIHTIRDVGYRFELLSKVNAGVRATRQLLELFPPCIRRGQLADHNP